MDRQRQIEWALRTVAGEDYLPWADVERAKAILGGLEGGGPTPEEIVASLLKVLHPGAVGLIGQRHGSDRLAEACRAVNAAKAWLAKGQGS